MKVIHSMLTNLPICHQKNSNKDLDLEFQKKILETIKIRKKNKIGFNKFLIQLLLIGDNQVQ